MRATAVIEDVQRCVHACLAAITGAPWSRWDVILGWPEADATTGKFVKPPIYVMPPIVTDWRWIQGGKPGSRLRMILGAWDDRGTGGTEEINLIASRLLDFFTDPKVMNAQTFTITIGTTTYTGTTLIAQGIRVDTGAGPGITGPRQIQSDDLKEFRYEFDLNLLV